MLVKIKREEKTREKEVTEPVRDANGDPVLDEFGKPKMEKVKKEEKYIDEFAVLKYLPTGKLEDFHIGGSPSAHAELIEWLEKIMEQQKKDQEEKKKKQQFVSKVKPVPAQPAMPPVKASDDHAPTAATNSPETVKAPPAAQPSTPAQPDTKKIEEPQSAATVSGTLSLENTDDKAWAYVYDPETQTIWISPPTADDRRTLAAHGGLAFKDVSRHL